MRNNPYRLPPWVLTTGFCLVAAGGCLDYQLGAIPWQTFGIAHWQQWLTFGLLSALLLSDREGPWRARLLRFGLCVLGGLTVVYLMHDHADEVRRRLVIADLWRSQALSLWLIAVWMAVPLLGPCRIDGVRRNPWLRWEVGFLVVYSTLCLGSAAASADPRGSLYFFGWERGLLFAPLLGWLRAAETNSNLRQSTGRAIVTLLCGLLVVAVGIYLVDAMGSPALRAKLVDWRLIYREEAGAGAGLPARRLLFPMLHFNRTGYFGLMAMMLLLTTFCSGTGRRGLRHFVAAGLAALGFLVILFSQTRGTILAGLAGLILWGMLSSRRLALGIVIGCLLLPFCLPSQSRRHLMTIFDPSIYDVRGDKLTSMKARILVWEWGLNRIAEHPLTGMGYGTNLVQKAYRDYVMREGDPRVRQDVLNGVEIVHAHNIWIETAVESGIPAMLILLAFLGGRWILLIGRWRRERGWPRRQTAAWLALEASLMIAGLDLYMLKNNSGFLNWYVWCYILLLLTTRDAVHSTSTAPITHAPDESDATRIDRLPVMPATVPPQGIAQP